MCELPWFARRGGGHLSHCSPARLDAVRGKNEWGTQNNEMHSASAKGPFALGDRFSVIFDYEVTPTTGPGSGKRTKMEEVALYTVKDGKIVREEFMY